jgi:hypothetical protein
MKEESMSTEHTSDDGQLRKVTERLRKANGQFLEDGEDVRAGVFGNSGRSALSHILLFGSVLRILRVSKDLIFLLTDTNLYILRGGFWRIHRGNEVIEKHARGEVAVQSNGLVVSAGEHSLVQIDYLRGSKIGAQFAALASQPA